jgi:Spy/CpxP family protein refolding chaperone
MKIHSKAAIALLALVISAPFALAQDPSQDPGQGQQGPPPDGPGGGRPTSQWQGRIGQDGQDRQWEGGDRWWGHDGEMEMRGHGQPGFMLARLVNNPDIREKLGITDDQAAKMRQQTSAFRISEVRSRADVQVKRIELRDLLTADNPDRAAIDSKLEEISAVRLASAKARVDYFFSMKDTLTPEQRQKLKDIMMNHFGGRGHGDFGGPHHPHPMGPGQPGNEPAPNGQAPANPPSGPGAE